ncbi:MAG: hypothetical protein ABJG41_12375 [Cyclobacteriaceae bacterium]
MFLKKAFLLLALIQIVLCTSAQKAELSVEDQLAQLELDMDSLSIFMLIDSLLSYQSPIYSELNIRTSYNSNVLSAGRNLGIDQHGISPGVSYYHKKGLYADVSGYWNSAFDPKYSLTIVSLGYMKIFGKHWSTTGSYERWFYNSSSNDSTTSTSLKNSLNLSGAYSTKYIYASLDYNYLFGQSKAHRIIGNISGTFTLKDKWVFDKIRIAPSVSVIYGNSDVYNYYYSSELQRAQYIGDIVQTEEFQAFFETVSFTNEELEKLKRIENSRRLSQSEKNKFKYFVYINNTEISDYVQNKLSSTSNEYGIMNYSFSLPVVFYIKDFNFSLSYSYSVPVKLPGEISSYDPIGYFGASVTYRIPFR